MNNTEYPDSDSSDEDYIPTTGEVVSEAESDGVSEEALSDCEQTNKRSEKRKRKTKKKPKDRTTHVEDIPENDQATKKLSEEERKKHADSLWDSFKRDTGFKKRSVLAETEKTNSSPQPDVIKGETIDKTVSEKVKVSQIFEFAGEEVVVEKEVAADSAEARLLSKPATSSKPSEKQPVLRKRAGLGGIGSVLNQIGKKQKLSTLEKTQLDWNKYKKEEKLEEELTNYRKGKDGYLEKQDFLERADLRTFEIERDVRAVERNKRLMNVPQT